MSMLKPWMVIGLVTFAIALFSNILRPKDIKWFRRLQRPSACCESDRGNGSSITSTAKLQPNSAWKIEPGSIFIPLIDAMGRLG